MNYANFSSRLFAYIIDAFIVVFVATFIGMMIPVSDAAINASEKANEMYNQIIEETMNGEDTNALMSEYQDLQYTVNKETVSLGIVTLIIYIAYYIVYQYYKNGQTIGKKLMKIRVVKDEGKLEFNDIIIRSLLFNGIIFQMIGLVMICILSKDIYLTSISYVDMAQSLFVMITAIMVLYRKDKKGLHDMICHTSVVKE